jgi:Niemann-Pick C1 protein
MMWLCDLMMAGLASGYGLCSGIGVPFNQLHLLLPFIVVGIGVDDLIIITLTFDQTNVKDPPELRIKHTLEKCGVSIAFTTLTDMVAFLLGATSSIPAIHGFCIYAAFSLFFNFVFQVTAYTSLLCLDAKRMNAGRMDVFFCITWVGKEDRSVQPVPTSAVEDNNNEEEEEEEKTEREVKKMATNEDIDAEDRPFSGATPSPSSSLLISHMTRGQYFFSEIYFPFINNLKVRLVVIASFIAFFGVNVYLALQLDIGLDLIILVPDGSYVQSYISRAREVELFGVEHDVAVFLFLEELNYFEKETTQKIISLQDTFEEGTFNSGPITSWVSAFNGWVGTSSYNTSLDSEGYLTDEEMYYKAVEKFLAVPHFSFFADHIVFNYEDDDASPLVVENIRISRVIGYHIEQDSAENRVSALLSARDVCDNADLSPEAFPVAPFYKFTEIDIIILQELLFNLSLAVLAVGLISMMVLINPKAVLLVGVLIISVDVEILGMMVFWDLTLNTVTLVQLVMAVGLVVDYMAHIAHHYSIQSSLQYPSNDEKLRVTLRDIAPSVSMGCFTTLLGVFPLSLASSTLFRMFFKMFLSIVIFGALHGFVLLPAVLPWISLEAHEDRVGVAATIATVTVMDGETNALVGEIPLMQQTDDALTVAPCKEGGADRNEGLLLR